MAMSNTTTAATNERPIPQWFVVTNSSLEGPALVSTPQDCWKHMNTRNQNHSNNGCRPPDAKAFYNIQDAIPYFEKLVKQHNVNSSSSQKEAAKSAMKALRAQAAGRTTDASPTKKRKLYHPETRAIAPPPPPTPTTTTTTTTTPTSSIPPLLTKAAPIIPPGSVATFAAYGMMAALAAPSFATTTTSNIPATLPHPSPPPPFPSPPPGAPKLKPEVDPEVDKQEKFNETFDRYLKLLKEFKNVYGDTDCPSRDGVYQVSNGQTINFKRYFGLGRWCSQIRTQLQIYDIAPNQSKLSKDQVQELRLIHFCRTPERHLETQSVFKEDHYQRLKYFHEKYGHSNVHWHKNTGLTIICSNLQAAYQRKQAGKTTMLTDEHVARLDAIEFSWTLKAARPTFDESATQWLAYKAKHNGQEPPAKQQLGCWAGHIRQKYHAKQQGKPSTLTEEQIQKLTDWGFRWESLKAPSALPVRKPKTFEERLVELQDYKDKFGDCLVPQKYPSLGHWARAVRRDYILYFEGQKTSLTDERVMSLGQMGFLFW